MLFTCYVASDVSNEDAYPVIETEEDSSPHSHHCDNIILTKLCLLVQKLGAKKMHVHIHI